MTRAGAVVGGSAPRRVVLATDGFGGAEDAELPVLVSALRERGVDAVAVDWAEEAYDWAAPDVVVIRSTWDYSQRLPEFLAWVDGVNAVTALHSPAGLVRWNSDKVYLSELAARGVPTVPTRFIAPGDPVTLPPDGEIVVKPSVSAGARDTARYTSAQRDAATAHIRMLHDAGTTAMVQPYMERIVDGERALVFLGGEFSHAVRKGPVLTDTGRIDNTRVAHPDLTGHTPSTAELALATAALSAVASRTAGPLAYARVDLAPAGDGTPVLMELELIEPNLFLTMTPGGVERFVEVVTGL
ncbi:hypothetical protein [Streptomyces sp. NPDC051577]|uniref:ATP-grasp domain-containing protein n=1 Tax=Streptomyces sp. NPDC051577 TaxID=3155166 RepID=UPI0034192D9A